MHVSPKYLAATHLQIKNTKNVTKTLSKNYYYCPICVITCLIKTPLPIVQKHTKIALNHEKYYIFLE